MENMIYSAQEGILLKQFKAPLASYTQANCQITLTDIGYRIYRPPNLSNQSNGGANNMWGGLILRFTTPPFIKGHTYIILFDVKGQTSNQPSDISWSNQAGWGGGGLSPTPSNVSYGNISANFESDNWTPVFYKWTINDDVYKTCTSAYSSFVQGATYPSYRDFKYGFGYTNTGTLGTDLYINHLRMYDITNGLDKINVLKTGILTCNDIIEVNENKKASFIKSADILCNNFYEY